MDKGSIKYKDRLFTIDKKLRRLFSIVNEGESTPNFYAFSSSLELIFECESAEESPSLGEDKYKQYWQVESRLREYLRETKKQEYEPPTTLEEYIRILRGILSI